MDVMMLKSVLLPLPFGPAMPKISPRSTESDTSSTARSEPNDLETLWTTRIGSTRKDYRKQAAAARPPREATGRRSKPPTASRVGA